MKYDLTTSANGHVNIWNHGVHEYVAGLSTASREASAILEFAAPDGTIYRVGENDLNSPHVQHFLKAHECVPTT